MAGTVLAVPSSAGRKALEPLSPSPRVAALNTPFPLKDSFYKGLKCLDKPVLNTQMLGKRAVRRGVRLTKVFSAVHHPEAEGLYGDTRVQLCQGGWAPQPSLLPALPGHGGHREEPRRGDRSAWSWGTLQAHMEPTAQLWILVQPCPALPIPALIPLPDRDTAPSPPCHPSLRGLPGIQFLLGLPWSEPGRAGAGGALGWAGTAQCGHRGWGWAGIRHITLRGKTT